MDNSARLAIAKVIETLKNHVAWDYTLSLDTRKELIADLEEALEFIS